METFKKYLLSILFFQLIGMGLGAQNFFPNLQRNCLDQSPDSVLVLSTGIDANGNLQAPGLGKVDYFWRLVNDPMLNTCSASDQADINGSAYLINLAALGQGWVNQMDATVISPVNAGLSAALSCMNPAPNDEAFIFDRVFCLDKAADVDVDLSFAGDDTLVLELIDLSNNNVLQTSSTFAYSNPAPAAASFNGTIFLSAGSYAVRASLKNWFGSAGLSVEGTVSISNGEKILRNGFTQNTAKCMAADTIATDTYYFYPDSALTICADLDSLVNPGSYIFQWFDKNGKDLNLSPSANQSCYTIPVLDAAAEGLYYCVATDTINNDCVVFPVYAIQYDQDSTGAWYIPYQLVVKYRSDIDEAGKQAFRQRHGLNVIDSCMCLIELLEIDTTGNPVIDPEEKKKKTGEDEDTEASDHNTVNEPQSMGGKFDFNPSDFEIGEKHFGELGFGGESENPEDSVVVAIIDTGIDYTDPIFDSLIWRNPEPFPVFLDDDNCRSCIEGAVNGYDFGDDDNDPIAVNTHGTNVAAAMVKVATELRRNIELSFNLKPKLRIMPLKVMDEKETITLFSVSCASMFAVRHGAQVINISLGGYGGYQKMVEAALNEVEDGACAPLVVTSAGNDGFNVGNTPHFFSSLRDSMRENVISVTGLELITDGDRNTVILDQELNFGDSISFAINPTSLVDGGTGAGAYGTSIAAAHTSGVLAHIFTRRTGISSSMVKSVLESVADPIQGTTSTKGIHIGNTSFNTLAGQIENELIANPLETCNFTFNVCQLLINTYDPPKGFDKLQVNVYPNPTSGLVRFDYEMPKRARICIQLIDASGKVIKELNERQGKGSHSWSSSINDLPNGIYFYKIISDKYFNAGKIIKSSR